MKLAYQSYDQSGKEVGDTIEARDAAEATETLRRSGLFVTQIRPTGEAVAEDPAARKSLFGRSGGLKKLAVFTRQFQILIATGTPIIDALIALERQTTETAWRQVIASLRRRVEEGTSLSEAMQEHPRYFDPIYRSLISAGEASGKLTPILDQLASLTRRQVNVRNNIVGALTYPLVLSLIAVSVLILLVTLVVPRFAEMFVMMDAPLPASTKVIIEVGHFLTSYWWAVSIALAAAIGGGFFWLKTDGGRRLKDTAVIRMPLVGRIVRSISTARLARFLGILLDSHLPLLESLNLLEQSTANVHYQGLIIKAQDAVIRGEPVSSGFSDSSLITPSVYQAMRSGEASGRIAPSLIQIADFMDEENEVIVRSLGSIVEPLILVILGVIVGLVALSMFTPLFDLTAASGGPV